MHSVAGILHRDIKPGNILIYPEGEEGNRGILIDYDHAIRSADASPYSMKRKIVGESLGLNGLTRNVFRNRARTCLCHGTRLRASTPKPV